MVRAVLKSLISAFACFCSSSPSRTPWFNNSIIVFSSGVSPTGRDICEGLWFSWFCRFITSRISSTDVAGIAPCFSNALQPALSGLVIFQGMANTSLPWFSAWVAVLRVPLRLAASIIITASAKPLIILLRFKKLKGRGSIPSWNSDIMLPPLFIMSSPNFRFVLG